jgi:hypothetical protein
MTFEEAMILMKAKRPAIEPIPAFRKQLQDYEKLCFESQRTANRGTKRKQDSDDGASPKKVGSAPIGPALPRTDESVNASLEEKMIVVRRTIGPALPPRIDKVHLHGNDHSQIGPSLPTKATVTIELPQSPSPEETAITGPAVSSAVD